MNLLWYLYVLWQYLANDNIWISKTVNAASTLDYRTRIALTWLSFKSWVKYIHGSSRWTVNIKPGTAWSGFHQLDRFTLRSVPLPVLVWCEQKKLGEVLCIFTRKSKSKWRLGETKNTQIVFPIYWLYIHAFTRYGLGDR